MGKTHVFKRRAAVLAIALATGLALLATAPGADAQTDSGDTFVSDPVTPIAIDIGPGTDPGNPSSGGTVPEGEPLPDGTPPAPRQQPDPVIQLSVSDGPQARIGQISAPDQNFAGIVTGSNPPDTVGDVGPNHYVQMVNATFFQVWDKQGNSLAGPTAFNSLWPGGNCGGANTGDPIVVYDHLADRWLLSQFYANGMCIAISQSPDPSAGTWFLYDFPTTNFPDYPKFGVWPDGYYMTTFEGNLGIYVFDRANMLLGNAAVFVMTSLTNPTPDAAGIRNTRILPADLDGPAPPVGTPNYMVHTVDDIQDNTTATDRVDVYTAAVNWAGPTLTFTLADSLGPAAYNMMVCNRNGGGVRDCIPQPDMDDTVDALSNRPMMQLKYRNFGTHEAMVFNQTIDISGSINALLGFVPANEVAGIRWYELRRSGAAWSIFQEGTFAPQNLGATTEPELIHRWMGSAAMDSSGNIAIGYNAVNDDDTNGNEIYPSLWYTGRRFDDGAGTLPQGEQVLLAGTVPQGVNGGGVNPQRWGDYAALSVDPADDCTFWFTGHNANGVTQIGSFRFDTCPAPVVGSCEGLTATITGTPGDDMIFGTPGDDIIDGLAGNDTILGQGGNDTICGNDGNDDLHGGTGADRLHGQSGQDELRGQDGQDFLKGGPGADQLWGGDGNDELVGNGGGDQLRGGRNDDLLQGSAGNDYLQGGPGNDELIGGGGTDTCVSGETLGGCEA